MKYNVIFKKHFSKVECVIDVINAGYNYDVNDYLEECYHNATDGFNEYLQKLINEGTIFLELRQFNMLDIKGFPDELLSSHGITQEMINIINETDLQTAENTTFTSLEDVKEYFEEMKEGVI